MTRRVTISLSLDEYQKAKYMADHFGVSVPAFCADCIVGTVHAELEAQASEAELGEQLQNMMLASLPIVGNA